MSKIQYLDLKNVSYDTNTNIVLKNLSFHVNRGEFIAIVGQSGIGKTTLLKLIAGLKKPSSGNISFSADHTRISFVFQTPSLLAWKSVIENVVFPLSLQRKPITKEILKQAKTILSLLEIQNKINCYPHELSEGQKQRVSLARALITKPSLILMDEPFASLDAMTRERLQQLLWNIWKKEKITILFVTHSISEATLLAQKIIILDGSPAEIHDCIVIPPKNDNDIFLASSSISNTITSVRKKVLFLWDKKTDEVDVPEKSRNISRNISTFTIPILTILGCILGYEVIRSFFSIPSYILPSLEGVFVLTISWLRSGTILQYSAQTVTATLGGFFIALPIAVLLGILSAKSTTISKVLTPLLVAFQVIPIIAYAPILIIWFGLDMASKMYTAGLISFFPIYMNTIAGIQSLPSSLRELKILYKTTPLKGFLRIDLPYAFPHLFSGLQVAITFSLVGAVVGEFMAGNQGLGHLISIARSTFNISGVFVCIIALWIIGISLQLLLKLLKKIFSYWANYSYYEKELP